MLSPPRRDVVCCAGHALGDDAYTKDFVAPRARARVLIPHHDRPRPRRRRHARRAQRTRPPTRRRRRALSRQLIIRRRRTRAAARDDHLPARHPAPRPERDPSYASRVVRARERRSHAHVQRRRARREGVRDVYPRRRGRRRHLAPIDAVGFDRARRARDARRRAQGDDARGEPRRDHDAKRARRSIEARRRVTRGVVGVDFFDVASSRHSASRARRRRAPRAR